MDYFIDDSDRLKPCPFCGGDAMFTVEQREGHPDFGGHSAMCGTCGAGIGYVFACGDDPLPLLMEQWNKREPSAATDAERGRWEHALALTWSMLDPCATAGDPGGYARGRDNGIELALKTLRENLGPNASLSRQGGRDEP